MNDYAAQIIRENSAWFGQFRIMQEKIPDIVTFNYLYDMAVPDIRGVPVQPYAPMCVTEDKVVRFGMLEGDAVVKADWVVYDPQNAHKGIPFGANGSTANHLALVLNTYEAGKMANMLGGHPSKIAPVLADQQCAEVVVIKMGPEGAFVWTPDEAVQVPAFRTSSVWKIGSGDCFVAHFANAWMHDGKTPRLAAEAASLATAYYCETQGFPTADILATKRFPVVRPSIAYIEGRRLQVYLAGPFFDLAQVWMVEQARANLQHMGLRVLSPYHDIGLGSAWDVVASDLKGIQESDLVLAITDGLDAGTVYEIGYARALNKPVIVYSERHKGEALKMMEGSGCIICNNYTTALYSTLWEAVTI
ncbi:PfkB family carbohydrate kinase [Acidithiobacillus sp. AMEEHan]|uniref:PfkB family carbohydrate kinase n=1 Tax=Acidithiobacillus sp. AMEEHan TaxID=2994951 RepID=UPI0027E5111A|nr:PfkB family carbohydrate kinase [Acidithiobacillus sp. AMEEHan]